MLPSLPFFIVFCTFLQAPPIPLTPETLKARAVDSQTLKNEGEKAMGCLAQESGTNSEQFQNVGQKSNGSWTGKLSSLAVDTNVIPKDERMPRFYAPGSRDSALGFKVNRLDGSSISIEECKGQPVVVFIFKPDCKYTGEMLSEVIRLQSVEDKARIKVFAVSISDGAWSDLARYRLKNINAIPATFPIYRPSTDPGSGTSIFKDLRVTPTTYILDRDGNVAWRIAGGIRGSLQDKINHIRTEPWKVNSQKAVVPDKLKNGN